MDPIEQMLAQGRGASSGNGPSPQFQAYEQGVQTSLSKRRLDQQQQQIDAELSLLPLKIAEAQMDQKMKSLTYQKQLLERDTMVKSADRLLNTVATVGRNLQDGNKNPDESRMAILDLLKDFPTLAAQDVVKTLFNSVETSEKAKFDLKKLQEDQETRKALARQPQGTPDAQDLRTITELRRNLTLAETPEEKAAAQQALTDFEAFKMPSGTEITTTKDGTNTIRIGKGATQPRPSTLDNRLKEKEINSEITLDAGARLLRATNPSVIGAKAELNHWLFNVIGPAAEDLTGNPLFGQFYNSDQIDYRTALGLYKTQVTKSLKSDGVIAEPERKALANLVPDVGVSENVKSTRDKLAKMGRAIADAQRITSINTGTPLPPSFWSPTEIKKAAQAGLITRDVARQLLINTPYRDPKSVDVIVEVMPSGIGLDPLKKVDSNAR